MVVQVVYEEGSAVSPARYLVQVERHGHVGTVRAIPVGDDRAAERSVACAIRLAVSLRCPIVRCDELACA